MGASQLTGGSTSLKLDGVASRFSGMSASTTTKVGYDQPSVRRGSIDANSVAAPTSGTTPNVAPSSSGTLSPSGEQFHSLLRPMLPNPHLQRMDLSADNGDNGSAGSVSGPLRGSNDSL